MLAIRPEDVAAVEERVRDLSTTTKQEYALADPGIRLELDQVPAPVRAFSPAATARFARLVSLVPNGVISWNLAVPGVVESSNNLGTVRTTDEGARLMATITSALTSRKHEVLGRVRSLASLAGADVVVRQFGLDAPEFPYVPGSRLLEVAAQTYRDVIGDAPAVHVSQCSLELGMFSRNVPGLETISIGTELHDLHSPKEKVSHISVAKVWPLVRELVTRLG